MFHLVSRSLLHLGKHPAPKLVFQQSCQIPQRSLSCQTPLPDLVTSISRQLEEAETPEPRLSAEYLVSCCLSTGQAGTPVMSADWTSHPASFLTEPELGRLNRLLSVHWAGW